MSVVRPEVLVVEDETVVALELSRQLRRAGFAVLGPASCGQDAEHLACSRRPDLVLMDACLDEPGCDGMAAARRIQRICGSPVILLTSDNDSETVERAFGAGAAGVLRKPYEVSELCRAIALAMGWTPAIRKPRGKRCSRI